MSQRDQPGTGRGDEHENGSAPGGEGGPGVGVWVTAQRPARTQRAGGRYVQGSQAHPARMLPAVAAHAIQAHSRPGDLVADVMCGAGTTLMEALRLGRPALGLDIEPRWVALARRNTAHTAAELRARGRAAPGATVLGGDARALADVLPTHLRGAVALVVLSPPYGPHTHGDLTKSPGRGVHKYDYTYGPRNQTNNLANLGADQAGRLRDEFARVLLALGPWLRPDARVVVVVRPWRRGGALVDLPGHIAAAAGQAGMTVVDRCVALLARIVPESPTASARTGDHTVVHNATFFQRVNTERARATGLPVHLIAHEDVLILAPGPAALRLPDADPAAPPSAPGGPDGGPDGGPEMATPGAG